MRIPCLALIVLALLMPSAFAARVALVIGNGAYKESPLKNPVNDVRDMSVKLKELGFTVIAKENLKRKEIPATLKAFRSQIKAGDDVLFFYAGHGLQVKGVNYLPAVDAEISSEDEVDMESLSLNKLLELLDESKAAVKLVFLDACRNNPYARSFRSADRGLSRIGYVAPSGTLISFATKPGSVAADGNGRNGLYTEQLLKYMGSENTPVEMMIKLVVREVKSASKGQQEPWSEGNLDGDFYFRLLASLEKSPLAAPIVRPVAALKPVESVRGSISERYLPLGDGAEIKDLQTGLIWQRCVEGMRWNGSSCINKPQMFTFDDAQTLAGNGWRLPTNDELSTLVDKARQQPAINTEAFPATPTIWFWTASVYSGNPVYAWRVLFFDGNVGYSFRTSAGTVRLVRSAP